MLAKGLTIVYNIGEFLCFFMKIFSKSGILVFTGFLMASILTGCSQDESAAVKVYNNSIVAIQKDMFTKAQDASKVLDQPAADIQKIYTMLQSVQSSISSSHDQFVAVKVPAGAENLSTAMESFYRVEAKGINDVITAFQQLQNNGNSPDSQKVFSDAFSKFSTGEDGAMKDFYAAQQQLGQKYGQKVLDTSN